MICFLVVLFLVAATIAQQCSENWSSFLVTKAGTDYIKVDTVAPKVTIQPNLVSLL